MLYPTPRKRVVDGVSYNTQTATVLAVHQYDDEADPYGREPACRGRLYLCQTAKNAFFEVDEGEKEVWDQKEEKTAWRDYCHFKPMSAEQAAKWFTTGDVEVYHNPFDEIPEAGAEKEENATIYVRLPASLKSAVEKAAQANNTSINTEVLRCLERCISEAPVKRAIRPSQP
jgi:predicted HicB family RNase H-like nuclease